MSWTNYLKKGLASALVILLGIIMVVAFGFNKSFDYTGGTIVSVNAKEYTEAVATDKVKTVLNAHSNINVCSFSVGSSKDEKVIIVKYQISSDVEATNNAIEEELYTAFGYDKNNVVESTFVVTTNDIQPAYNFSVVTYALITALVALLAVSFYIWLRLGLGSAITLISGVVLDILCGLAFFAIFRIEISANIGYAIWAITTLSIIVNTIMLNRLHNNANAEENKKLPNAQIADQVRQNALHTNIMACGLLAVVLLIFAIIAFGPAGSAVLAVAISMASVFVTSTYVLPNIWRFAFVRKTKTRTKKPIEIESEVE